MLSSEYTVSDKIFGYLYWLTPKAKLPSLACTRNVQHAVVFIITDCRLAGS